VWSAIRKLFTWARSRESDSWRCSSSREETKPKFPFQKAVSRPTYKRLILDVSSQPSEAFQKQMVSGHVISLLHRPGVNSIVFKLDSVHSSSSTQRRSLAAQTSLGLQALCAAERRTTINMLLSRRSRHSPLQNGLSKIHIEVCKHALTMTFFCVGI
jgi:hypothetical protein